MEEEKINSWSALVCHQTALGVGGGVGGVAGEVYESWAKR